jgi:non-heme chloroperoxidase
MTKLTVGQENSSPVELYYEDHGTGQPVVLIAGFPLSGAAWEKQTIALLDAGFRVITYDRRGFGQSSKVVTGYDYDTFAADLNAVITELDVRDVVLVGHSMGTGEVTRYLGAYGSERVSRAVLIESLAPFLLKTDDNPEGIDQSVFDGARAAIVADRPAYLADFFDAFYNSDVLLGTRVSAQAMQASFIDAAGASAKGTYNCVETWETDFRADVAKIDVPLLVIHGSDDRILPPDATGRRMRDLVEGVRYVEIEGGPHNVPWTHADEVNGELLAFLEIPTTARTPATAA